MQDRTDSPDKTYTENDLHRLVGKAMHVIQEGLEQDDLHYRIDCAVKLLSGPIGTAILRAQLSIDQFPDSLLPDKEDK